MPPRTIKISFGGSALSRSAAAAALFAQSSRLSQVGAAFMSWSRADARSQRMPPVQYMSTLRPASFFFVSGRFSHRGNSCELRILGSKSSAPPGGGTMRPISVSYWFRTSMTTAPGVSKALWYASASRCLAEFVASCGARSLARP